MKNRFRIIFLLLTCVFGSVSFSGMAQNVEFVLPKNSQALIHLEGVATSFADLCPKDTNCLTGGTVVGLMFSLPNCQYVLGPVTFLASKSQSNETEIFVSALAIKKRGANTSCNQAVREVATLTFVNEYFTQKTSKFRFLKN